MTYTAKNDIFHKLDIDETNRVIEEASSHFREHRLSYHKGIQVLVRNGLLFETEEYVEQQFLEQEEEQRCETPGVFLKENSNGFRSASRYSLEAVQIMRDSKDRELSRWGYPTCANTGFSLPDAAQEKWGVAGLGFNVKELLYATATQVEADYPDQAAMYRNIADEFYLSEAEVDNEEHYKSYSDDEEDDLIDLEA